jgi:hypothetical protein
MTGSKYSYAVTQLESQGVLNPDAHMFVQDNFYQAEPDVVTAIMKQLSRKAGLKEWGGQTINRMWLMRSRYAMGAKKSSYCMQSRDALGANRSAFSESDH